MATAAASAQVSKFCIHMAILGIKLSHLLLPERVPKKVLRSVVILYGTYICTHKSLHGNTVQRNHHHH
jgi:hypothetical protein